MSHTNLDGYDSPSCSISHRQKERVIFKSLIIDFSLWIPDIIIALLSGSVTLYADVIKSGNEILSTLFAWIALRKMAKGGSHAYDYGMGKFENLTGMTTGLVMFLSLILIFAVTIFKLLNPSLLHEEMTKVAILMMVVGFFVNIWLYREKQHLAQEEYSPVLESQAKLFKTKAITDLTVVIALVLVMFLSEYSWSIYIDPLASFVVIGFFMRSGYRIISKSLPDLLDQTIDEDLQLVVVRSLAVFFTDYEAFHGVRSRRSGNFIYIELFLEFDGERKMSEIQDTINRMKRSLEDEIPNSSITIMPSTGKFGSIP